MKNVIQTDASFKLPVWYKPLLAILIAIVLGAVFYVTVIMSGWGGYAYAYLQCGGNKPIIAIESFKSRAYQKPSDAQYHPPAGSSLGTPRYFCTEDEARANRFRHLTY